MLGTTDVGSCTVTASVVVFGGSVYGFGRDCEEQGQVGIKSSLESMKD